ncbi:hypothetical protein [Blautia difficilis]|nr:hypothetical protein [Blautia difficilis]
MELFGSPGIGKLDSYMRVYENKDIPVCLEGTADRFSYAFMEKTVKTA